VNLIRKIREETGKTQEEFCRELNITQSALSQMENKNRLPSMKTFLLLVKQGYINKDNIYPVVQELIRKQ